MLDKLDEWLLAPTESEHLEFKEAKNTYADKDVHRYCVALANEGGGALVLGVSDRLPRQVVGTRAFRGKALQRIRDSLRDRVQAHVAVSELDHRTGRVIVFEVLSRPVGMAIELDGAYLMRSGESLVSMPADRLRQILLESSEDWMAKPCTPGLSDQRIVNEIDTQTFFDLRGMPYPTTREGVISRLLSEGVIVDSAEGKKVTNMGALALAKQLEDFPRALARKAPRVVVYEGDSKVITRTDRTFSGGIATVFDDLVQFVHATAPQNVLVEKVIRQDVRMFPMQAVRELIANALLHQDFSIRGSGVMIELFSDRLEISNPGIPPIGLDHFIDEHRSRNEALADLMRRLGICEEKGSGIDKVIRLVEDFQLPPPDFLASSLTTTAILFAHQDFGQMPKDDRIRACYQHCVLMYISRKRMTNATLRERFGLSDDKTVQVSQIIGHTRDAGLVKLEPSESASTRYARYIPGWA